MSLGLQEGTIFAGRYRILRRIAQGGMGAVYEVMHLETDRRRALKVMHPHILANQEMHERFKLEAKVAAHIESDFIVDVFDAGVDDATQMPFLVMELLRGEELGMRLKRLGPLPPEEVVLYLHQTALALDKTHKASIVHRDLKPENLFLTEREDSPPRIKVLDFGIAKIVAESATSGGPTQSIGTPLYMSPEQFNPSAKLSGAADIYALGMIAYTLLIGAPYWDIEARAGNIFALAAVVVHGPPQPASVRAGARGLSLPPAFDPWFARVTAVNPAYRYPTATLTARALAEVFSVSLPMAGGLLAQSGISEGDPRRPVLASAPDLGAPPSAGSGTSPTPTTMPLQAPGPMWSPAAAVPGPAGPPPPAQASHRGPFQPSSRATPPAASPMVFPSPAAPPLHAPEMLPVPISSALPVSNPIAFQSSPALGAPSASAPEMPPEAGLGMTSLGASMIGSVPHDKGKGGFIAVALAIGTLGIGGAVVYAVRSQHAPSAVSPTPTEAKVLPTTIPTLATSTLEPVTPAGSALAELAPTTTIGGILASASSIDSALLTHAPVENAAPPAGVQQAPRKREFDKGIATAAINAATRRIKYCTNITAGGQAKIKFAPDGHTMSVILVDSVLSGTPDGLCVASIFRSIIVPPFDGDPVVVIKSFTIQR